ncbi:MULTISPECIES: MFS transporter [unclassified Phyllobacterium]|uniref:MFS transporter n=1 Tax=unclassified Phyllobacterium TaxID=2638441 RepID=UPI003012B71C
MPLAVYMFSLCTFAFGLSEFVVAGLVSAVAIDLHADIGIVGTVIATYAFGATIGAPLLTALVSHWQEKHVLILAMVILAVGSLAMSVAPDIFTLLVIRFAVGLSHGVFMAVASDAATKLTDPAKAGRAVSVVWIGLTLALALGVPLGTYLGNIWSWRVIFIFIGVLGVLAGAGLLIFMNGNARDSHTTTGRGAWAAIRAIIHPQLMIAAGVGVLVSLATFSFFTFVAPYLLEITDADIQGLSAAMLLFGLCTVAGNLIGGYIVDKTDVNRSVMIGILGLGLNLTGLYLFNNSQFTMVLLIGLLGVSFFSTVTMLTIRLLKVAERYVPGSTAVAAGLNIASFNLGTALGGVLGSATIASGNLPLIPLAGAFVAGVAVLILAVQMRRAKWETEWMR